MKIKKLLFIGLLVLAGVAFNAFQPSNAHQTNEVTINLNHEVTSELSDFQTISPTLAPSVQQQIDDLLEAYKQALQDELKNGETVEVEDELGERTIMLAGESAEKIEALWQETIGRINELSARPSEERNAAVQLIRSIDESQDVIYLDRDRSLYDNGVELERYMTSKFHLLNQY